MSDVPPSYPPPPPPPPPPGSGGFPPPPQGPGPGGYGAPQPTGPGGLALAEWWQRLVAVIIDAIIVGVVGSIASAVLPGFFFRVLAQTLIGAAYYAYFNGEKGQTVGKMVLKLKTVDATTGGLIGLNAGIMRALIYPVGATFTCGILAIVDGIMIFTDPSRMSLHDKVAKSQVVVVSDL